MAAETVAQASFGWAGNASSVRSTEDGPEPDVRVDRQRPAVGPQRPPSPTAQPFSAELRPTPPAHAVERTATACDRPLPPENELWDVHAAARFLKRSVSWVYHRAEDGTLPVKRLGGWGVRFIPAELRAWVEGKGMATGNER